MTTVDQRLATLARTQPQQRFCSFATGGRVEHITFGELYERSLAYAQCYAEHGIASGDVIIVILKHTPHLFYAFLGAIAMGAVPSFMPFPTPKQRPELYWGDHDALFERIEPRAIVTYEQNLAGIRSLPSSASITTIIADDALLARASGTTARHAAAPDDVACLQHSSGTTHLKKGVMLTHREILEAVDAYASALGFGGDDSIASWLPLYHDMGFVACFMASVLRGTHLVALDPFEWTIRPHLLFEAIETYRATFCWLPNFAFSHLVNTARPDARWDLSSIRAFVNCSEPCKAHTFERFAARFASSGVTPQQLQVCYAMAENVFGVTQTPLDRPVRVLRLEADAFGDGRVRHASGDALALDVVSCGPPIDGVQLEIADPDGGPLEPDRIGEIKVTSPFLFSGYHRLPDVTAQRLRGGWYATGDMGFIADGELYVTGRIDDMIIVNGRNYYSHELEAIVNAVDGILPGRNVAIGVEDGRTDATTVVILAEIARDANAEQIAGAVRLRVSQATGLAVHAVVPVGPGELVKTTSGKISRSKNKELFLAGAFVLAN